MAWVAVAGAGIGLVGSIINSSGSKAGSQSSTSTNNTAPQLLPGMDQLLGPLQKGALDAFGRPVDQAVAGFTPDQLAAMDQARGIATNGSTASSLTDYANTVGSGIGGATSGALSDLSNPIGLNPSVSSTLTAPINPSQVGTQNFDSAAAAQYMSPYTQDVLNSGLNQIDYANTVNTGAENAKLAGEQAFGSRGDLAGSILARNQADERNNFIGTTLNTGYTNAEGQFNADQNRSLTAQQSNQAARLTAASLGITGANDLGNLNLNDANATTSRGSVLGNLGLNSATNAGNLLTGAQNINVQNAGLLNASGTEQQNLNQTVDNYPNTANSNLAGILYGAPTGSNSTSTTPGPNLFGQIGGAVTALGSSGLFSSPTITNTGTYDNSTTDAFGGLNPGGATYAQGGRVGYADGGMVGDSPLGPEEPTLLSKLANAGKTAIDARTASATPMLPMGHITRGRGYRGPISPLPVASPAVNSNPSFGSPLAAAFADGGSVGDTDPDARRSNALLTAGLAAMASRSPFPLTQIGEGGLAGIEAYNAAPGRIATDALRREQAQAADIANQEGNLQLETDKQIAARNGTPTKAGAIAAATSPLPGIPTVASPLPAPSDGSQDGFDGTTGQGQMTVTPSAGNAPMLPQSGPAPAPAPAQPPPMIDMPSLMGLAKTMMAGPASRAQGVALLTQAQDAVKTGEYMSANGQIYVYPGKLPALQSEEAAKAAGGAPYKIAEAAASQAGRAIKLSPGETATTGFQTMDPGMKALIARTTQGSPVQPASAQPVVSAPMANNAPVSSIPAAMPPRSAMPLAPGTDATGFPTQPIHNPDGTLSSPLTVEGEETQKNLAKQFESDAKDFQSSQSAMSRLDLIDHNIDLLNQTGWSSTGAGNASRMQFAKGLNSVAATFGLDPAFDPAKIGSWEDVQKESTRMGFDIAKQLGSREAMMIVQQAVSAVPGSQNTYLGARLVSSSIRQALQRQMDYYQFEQSYAQKHGGSTWQADAAFNKQNPTGLYTTRAVVNAIPDNAKGSLIANPKLAPQFDAKYGTGMSASVLGQTQ